MLEVGWGIVLQFLLGVVFSLLWIYVCYWVVEKFVVLGCGIFSYVGVIRMNDNVNVKFEAFFRIELFCGS